MSHPALRIAAARHFLDLARQDELIDAAHAALDDGIYSYSLGEVATYQEPIWFDLETLFKYAMQELGIEPTNWDEAVRVLTEVYLVPLAEGASVPVETVGRIHADYARLTDDDLVPEALESLAPLAHFLDFHYRYEDSHEWEFHIAPELGQPTEIYRQERERINAAAVALAWEWCQNRWRSSIDPAWLTTTVTALARGISDEQAFDRLPILADALQDAGCEHADILDHCRSRSPHTRGCWVVDLILDKS